MKKISLQLVALLLSLLLAACQSEPESFFDQHRQPVMLDGNWLIINYWATWCKPCRREVPDLNLLHQQLAEQPIKIIGVNFDHLQGTELIEASNSLDIRFTILARDPADYFKLPVRGGLPVTFLIDPNGRLRASLLGEQSAQSIRQQLQQLGALATEDS